MRLSDFRRCLLLLAALGTFDPASAVAAQWDQPVERQSDAGPVHGTRLGPTDSAAEPNRPVAGSAASTLMERRPGGLAARGQAPNGIGFLAAGYEGMSTSVLKDAAGSRSRVTPVSDVARAGLIGAGIGAVAGGVMELVDPDGEIADVWPVLLAVPGFLIGPPTP